MASRAETSEAHRPSTPATASIGWEDAVLRIIGTPSARAARATASSASLCTIDMYADRRQHDRCAELDAKHLDAQIAPRHVTEEARDDPPAAEGLAIGPHRVLRPGSPRHVIECLGLQDRFGLELELVDRDGMGGGLAGESLPGRSRSAAAGPRRFQTLRPPWWFARL